MVKSLLALLLLFSLAPAFCGEERIEKNGTVYRTFVAKPGEVRIYWLGENGKPLRQFSAVQAYLKRQGLRPVLLLKWGHL